VFKQQHDVLDVLAFAQLIDDDDDDNNNNNDDVKDDSNKTQL